LGEQIKVGVAVVAAEVADPALKRTNRTLAEPEG
jgi:hypothetical protein